MFASLQSVFEERADCHWTYAAGDGCDVGRKRRNILKIDVAAEFPTGFGLVALDAGGANIDDGATRFYHIGSYKTGLADGCNEDVGCFGDFLEIFGARMTNCNGGVHALLTHQDAQRTTNNVAATYDNAMFASGGDVVTLQQIHNARRCGGYECVESGNQPSKIDGMKTVNILLRVDSLDYLLFVNVFGQRQLNDKTVNIGIVIEFCNGFQEFVLGDVVLKTNQRRLEADLFA